MNIGRRLVAEGLGSAMLLALVVGSGIMAERLAGGNVAIALLANALATGAGLVALILMFGSISGAHFNPVVTLSEAAQGNLPGREVLPYIAIQIVGAFAGVAAVGLIAVIIGCSRSRPAVTPFAVAAYITAAYWFTSSTSFANPAVTLARSATNTFAGIRPVDAPGLILAQLVGAAAATAVFCWLYPAVPAGATVAGTVPPGDFAAR